MAAPRIPPKLKQATVLPSPASLQAALARRVAAGVYCAMAASPAAPAEANPTTLPGHRVPIVKESGSPAEATAMTEKYSGTCFCGAVEVEVSGAPEAMGYCHCASCRSWSAGPVNAFTLWKPENVRVTRGAEHRALRQDRTSDRQFCTRCGGHLMTHHRPARPHRCLRGDPAHPRLHARRPRELRRDRAADEGRPAQAEGLPRRTGRFGYRRRGITQNTPGAATLPMPLRKMSISDASARRLVTGRHRRRPDNWRRSPCPTSTVS